MEEKKKIRKIIKKQEEEEMAARGHDDDDDDDEWPAHMTTTRFSQGFSPGSSARQSPQQQPQPSFAMGQVPQLGADPLRSMNSSNGNMNMMPSNSPIINGQGGRRPSPQMGLNDGGIYASALRARTCVCVRARLCRHPKLSAPRKQDARHCIMCIATPARGRAVLASSAGQ